MINDDQIYIVVDIEADGQAAGQNSMLALAAVATSKDAELGTFYATLQPLDGAVQDPATMDKFWRSQPKLWQEVTSNAQPAEKVMNDFAEWLVSFGKQPVFVSHPVAFDFSMVNWYLWKFCGKNPFHDETRRYNTLDISSFVSGKFGLELKESIRPKLPKWMKEGMPVHSHEGVDDARGYAVLLRNILNHS